MTPKGRQIAEQIRFWHRIDVDPDGIDALAADLAGINDSALDVAERMRFEDEPATFAATLEKLASPD